MVRNAHGFALIDLVFVVGIIGVLAGIALPRMMTAKQLAGASSAIGSMRSINSAELTYALTCGAGFYAPKLSTLGTPPPDSNEAFIGGGLGAADKVVKANYIIQLTAIPYPGAPASCNGVAAGAGGQGFRAAADPAEPSNPRFFATNANALIFEHSSTLYPTMPETGSPPAGTSLR